MPIYAGYGANEYAKKSGAKLVFKSTASGQSVEFAAFLTDFSQTFSSEWNTDSVYGRNDPIATFQGTKRTITLAWDIPSSSLTDAQGNLKNCEELARMMYPRYLNGMEKKKPINKNKNGKKNPMLKSSKRFQTNIISAPPLIKISFANLISSSEAPTTSSKSNKDKKVKEDAGKKTKGKAGSQDLLAGSGLLGYIGSLNWKPVLDMGMFSSGNKFYPKVISLSIDFTVLHQHFLGVDNYGWMGRELFKT